MASIRKVKVQSHTVPDTHIYTIYREYIKNKTGMVDIKTQKRLLVVKDV